ncbi:hypothetical protein [Nocardia wallacei]|uniref:hypothetical protein n=1 Tax=Nocardia wallacei TaxID=480035 RepID=UPI002454C6D1|nr:hypothetical protein [Nocardia wallacei]
MPRRIGRILDSESVRAYQILVYLAYLAAGLNSLWAGSTPSVVAQSLGPVADAGWVALVVGGPLVTFAGMRLERRHVAGLWMQLAGDCAVACASVTYVAAVSQTVWAGRSTFAVWVVLALAVCAAALVVRGVRKLRTVTRIVRRMNDE